MTQNDSFPKHLVVILYVVIVLMILTGCKSVSDGLAGGDKPQMKASICHDKARVKAYTECWEAEMKAAFQESEQARSLPSFDIRETDDSILQLDYLLKAR